MHSAHENPQEGNLRMPWVYGAKGTELMRKYFTLRAQLLPYLYTQSWLAHRESIPLMRPLYLEYPDLEEAYRHPHEYFLGAQLLIAPVLAPGGDHAVYLPPGQWRDFFTGKAREGGATFTAHYAVAETPVFVRDGAIVPEQRAGAYSDERPLDHLILNVFGAANGTFELYEDDGSTLAYDKEQAHTLFTHAASADGSQRLTIAPTEGTYKGQPVMRSYEVRLYGSEKPRSVAVNGAEVHWSWDSAHGVAVIPVASQPIHESARIEWR
jgi:alpha-glucosidase (family GH31 glycosyl hydrolase)